ncbi:type II secretion system GspH family protein [Candidatus Gracilibacteria bacterium]|nr:type II secretion system GspH family protein [Candidatus Gracilibacteria bacterium]
MKLVIKKGFTLIELLVVITIIGILATGAVQVFTSQIQKARDATRISDITALRGGIEQAYQALGSYPDKGTQFETEVTIYVPNMPTDPKSTEGSGTSVFDYLYNVSDDANTIRNQEFEVSTHFENAGNLTSRAATDGGDDPVRLEFGINVAGNNTIVANSDGIAAGIDSFSCVTAAAAADAGCADANPMVIKGN